MSKVTTDAVSRVIEKARQVKRDGGIPERATVPIAPPVAAFMHRGLRCVVSREGPYPSGWVHVPASHILSELDYDDVADAVDVHGGLVFSSLATDGGMWFGFSCGCSYRSETDDGKSESGRFWDWVKAADECKSLAEQLADIDAKHKADA